MHRVIDLRRPIVDKLIFVWWALIELESGAVVEAPQVGERTLFEGARIRVLARLRTGCAGQFPVLISYRQVRSFGLQLSQFRDMAPELWNRTNPNRP